MIRSFILGASTLLNVLIQHLPLQSLFWSKTWRACRASDPSKMTVNLQKIPEAGRPSDTDCPAKDSTGTLKMGDQCIF